LKTHQDWTQAFLAAPTVLGVIGSRTFSLRIMFQDFPQAV
jgi:hypothetical protein